MSLAPGEKSGNSCEKVGQGTSWQQRVCVDCGCKGKDIVAVNVGICPFCSPFVSQIQRLLGAERAMRRQVSCSGKIPQKECALASVVPLQC